jgi:hypothetical protein
MSELNLVFRECSLDVGKMLIYECRNGMLHKQRDNFTFTLCCLR